MICLTNPVAHYVFARLLPIVPLLNWWQRVRTAEAHEIAVVNLFGVAADAEGFVGKLKWTGSGVNLYDSNERLLISFSGWSTSRRFYTNHFAHQVRVTFQVEEIK